MDLTRRSLFAQAGAAAAALSLLDAPPAARAAWSDAGHWAFADRMQALLEPSWRPARRAYVPRGDAGETSHNANLLYTHAAAARAGTSGRGC